MTEVELPGSNPVMMDTTAITDGDDYVINGQKWYTTAADGAAFAVVMAITDPDAPPYRRASMILVPCDTPGFDLVRNISVMGHAGDGWASHGEILYHSCRVPRSNLLGPEGHGFAIAQERLGPGRIHHCMRWIGICNRAFDLLCSRATTRVIEPGVTLGDKDIVRAWIADSAAEIRAARLLTLHTAWKIDSLGWRAAHQDISMIKFVVANTMQRVVDRALQVHGGLGMTDDTLIAFFFRHERAARIYDGPDEVHKISLAKRILREGSDRTGAAGRRHVAIGIPSYELAASEACTIVPWWVQMRRTRNQLTGLGGSQSRNSKSAWEGSGGVGAFAVRTAPTPADSHGQWHEAVTPGNPESRRPNPASTVSHRPSPPVAATSARLTSREPEMKLSRAADRRRLTWWISSISATSTRCSQEPSRATAASLPIARSGTMAASSRSPGMSSTLRSRLPPRA